MWMADRFHADERYRIQALGKTGVRADDHPLIVQFAANDPRDFAEAALAAQQLGADGVDLNLGCPQTRAKEGHYGAYLTDPHDHALCAEIIAAAADHPEITIPITVKIRLQPTTEQTVAFANLLADAGASLVAVHGRRRGTEEKRRDGSADLEAVAAVAASLKQRRIPIHCLTNGNVKTPADVAANVAATGCAGIMVAGARKSQPGFGAAFHGVHALEVTGTGTSARVPCLRDGGFLGVGGWGWGRECIFTDMSALNTDGPNCRSVVERPHIIFCVGSGHTGRQDCSRSCCGVFTIVPQL